MYIIGIRLIIFFQIINFIRVECAFEYKSFVKSINDVHALSGMDFGSEIPSFVTELYEKNVHLLEDCINIPDRIPKIIHFIWVGGNMPPYLNFCIESWRNFHPEWQIIMWDDQKVKELKLVNRALYDGMTNFGCKADILRLEILKQFGGVYIDTDFFCLKPIDILIKMEYFHSSESNNDSIINNGIIGCTPNHRFINEMISGVSKISLINSNHNDVLNLAGPLFVTSNFIKQYERDNNYFGKNAIILPPSYFCSFPNHLALRHQFWMGELSLAAIIEKYTFSESFAVHLWNSSWFISRRDHIFDVLNDSKLIFTKSNDFKDVINAKDENGRTPLLIAVINNKVNVIEELLKNGADTNLTDKDGINAIDCAKKTGNYFLLEPYLNTIKHKLV